MLNKLLDNYELLVIEGKDYQGETIVLPAPSLSLTLGRDPQACNLVFTQSRISRNHCKIFAKNNNLYVENNTPRNGTYINKDKLKKHEKRILKIMDKINLAKCQTLLVVSIAKDTIQTEDLKEFAESMKNLQDTQQTSWISRFFGTSLLDDLF